MTARVTAALRAVEIVAFRSDPTEPVAVGSIARRLGMPLSSVSRLCSELEREGLLEHGEGYGTYRLGAEAVRLSGRATAPFARSLRLAFLRAAQETGETVCLVARSSTAMRITAVVDSPRTLHAPAQLGETVDDAGSAVVRAAETPAPGDQDPGGYAESDRGRCAEVAVPVLDPVGACVAVLAVRLPASRSRKGVPAARRALETARRTIEHALTVWADDTSAPQPAPAPEASASPSALQAAIRILWHLAAGQDTVAGTAAATGLRFDRAKRLIESCRRAGLVSAGDDQGRLRLEWILHGWYRAAAQPTLVRRGTPLVAEAARSTGVSAFLTTLKGMRSFTLVEELQTPGDGLRMEPWRGRLYPLIGSDGGPTLVMDMDPGELAQLLPARHTTAEVNAFRDRVLRVARDGVLSFDSIEDVGLTSISAPVRDAGGGISAAACLVGPTEQVRPRRRALEAAVRRLAAEVSARLECPPEVLSTPAGRSRRDGG